MNIHPLKKKWQKILLLLFFVIIPAALSAQNLTFKPQEITIKEFLKKVTEQSGYKFVYTDAVKGMDAKIKISAQNETFEKLLTRVLNSHGIYFKIQDKYVLLSSESSSATNKAPIKIKGNIMDEDQLPLAGAYIYLKQNQKIGVTANNNGEFDLEIPDNYLGNNHIIVSYIGMQPQEIPIDGRTTYKIILIPDSQKLDDVVVTGYQTISKERATGAFSIINEEAIAKRPVTNIKDALTGLTTGIEVKSDGKFIIRGVGTMSTETDPLIVVDGFPVQGDLSNINPNDVKSINILKDAAATSIWGARAANGVIVITTKNPQDGKKLDISINSFFQIGSKIDLKYALDFASPQAVIAFDEAYFPLFKPTFSQAEMVVNSMGNARFTMSESMQNIWELERGAITREQYEKNKQDLLSRDYTKDYNKYLLRNSFLQQHNLVITGAGEKHLYKISALYEQDKTSFKENNQHKFILNFNNTVKILKNLSYTASINVKIQNQENNGATFKGIRSTTTSFTKLYNPDGSYYNMPVNGGIYLPFLDNYKDKMPYSNWEYNILKETKSRKMTDHGLELRIQNKLDWEIIEGLKVSAQFQYENNTFKSQQLYRESSYLTQTYVNFFSKYNSTTDKYESSMPKGAIVQDNSSKYSSYNVRGDISYNKSFGKNDVTILLGGEILSSTMETDPLKIRLGFNERSHVSPRLNYAPVSGTHKMFDTKRNTSSTLVQYEGIGFDYRNASGWKDIIKEDRYLSAYFNAAYTYDSRYTASISLRTDASNFVSENVRNKFSPFWSVGASWNIKKEKFMEQTSSINRLIVRASYGVSGLAAGRSGNSTLTTVAAVSPNLIMDYTDSYYIRVKGNPSLSWEKSATLNMGVDFDFFNHKLFGSVDYYHKKSSDIISSVQTSYMSQSSEYINLNAAEIRNQGIELSLGTSMNIAKNFNWTSRLNFTYNSNKVTKFDYVGTAITSYTAGTTYIQGKPVSTCYAVKIKGYTKEGIIVTENKDGSTITVDTPANNPVGLSPYPIPTGTSVDDSNYLYYQGTLTPKSILGFSNTFTYKNLSFSFIISGKFGHVFKRNDDIEVRDINKLNYRSSLEGYWKQGDPLEPFIGRPLPNENNAPALRNSYMYAWYNNLISASDYNYEKGDFIRLEEVHLEYTFPRKITKSFCNSLNVFTQIRNCGIIWAANGKGIDPDYIKGLSAKPITLYTFGLKINF